MTIEKEAREIAEGIEKILDGACVSLGLADYDEIKTRIAKALQKKQDRIEELERSCGLLGLEKNACERKIKELEKTEESVLNLSHPNIKMLLDENEKLKSALIPFIEGYKESWDHGPFSHGLFVAAKKAIGGGK